MHIFVSLSDMDELKKDKFSYVRPLCLVIGSVCRGVLCSSFGGSSNESMGFGDSYDENTFN